MADTKITDLAALAGGSIASGDEFVLVDVSDTSMAATGTDKKTTANDVATAVAALLSLSGTYQPLDSDLTAIAALTTTATGRSLLAAADAAALRTILALGSLSTLSTVTSTEITDGTIVSGDISASAAITNAQLATEAQSTIKGRAAAAGTGAVTDLTATQVRTVIDTNTTPSTQVIGDSAAVGTADTLARGDHKHALPTAGDIYALAETINAQSGTTYTHVLTDSGKLVTLSNASAITFTVDTNANVATPVGTRIDLAQIGAGQVTVAAAGGVTVNATPGLKFRAQYSAATLVKTATNTWLLLGDLSA